jgi:hypothetical protein
MQIPNVEGEQPIFGPGGEIFFRKVEGSSGFLNSVRADGSGLRRAADLSRVVDVLGAPPDRNWLLLGVLPKGEVVLPIAGGAPVLTHLLPPHWPRWTGDGKHVFVCAADENSGRTYILPLSPGQILPGSIALAKSSLSEGELAKMPGVRIIEIGDVVPGPTADTYAFTRENVQRNLYRIPLR